MHPTLILVLSLALPLRLGLAIALPPARPVRLPSVSTTRQSSSAPPSCDLTTATQPSSALTAPASGLTLSLIASGRGTQNYTCATPTSTPVAIGAVAQLFNASCDVAANLPISATAPQIGTHFFVDTTTPEFDIQSLGSTALKKAEGVSAPTGSADVPWLRLTAVAGGSSSVKEIYRLQTSGGVAPATCEGKAEGEVVVVGYEAQYWVYTG